MAISDKSMPPGIVKASVQTVMGSWSRDLWLRPYSRRSWQKVQCIDLPSVSDAGLHRAGTEREGFTPPTRSTGCGLIGRPAGRQYDRPPVDGVAAKITRMPLQPAKKTVPRENRSVCAEAMAEE